MNAFYVIVSIPLLLVLAGFNHAHGLTTFGKNPKDSQNEVIKDGTACKVQATCANIRNTTCLKGRCLCGDNRPPSNGQCQQTWLGPNHVCTKSDDCVENADCLPIKEVKINKDISHLLIDSNLNICVCQEGFVDTGAACGGGRIFGVGAPFMLLTLAFYKLVY